MNIVPHDFSGYDMGAERDSLAGMVAGGTFDSHPGIIAGSMSDPYIAFELFVPAQAVASVRHFVSQVVADALGQPVVSELTDEQSSLMASIGGLVSSTEILLDSPQGHVVEACRAFPMIDLLYDPQDPYDPFLETPHVEQIDGRPAAPFYTLSLEGTGTYRFAVEHIDLQGIKPGHFLFDGVIDALDLPEPHVSQPGEAARITSTTIHEKPPSEEGPRLRARTQLVQTSEPVYGSLDRYVEVAETQKGWPFLSAFPL